MGSRERREREREELREKILDAARVLFATHGFEATTMRMVANRIEYSATAIYSYFKDKETLLRELCEVDFSALSQSMAGALQTPNPVERLERIGEIYVDYALRHPNQYRFMFMSQPRDQLATADEAAEKTPTAPEKGYAFIRQAVQDVIASGVVRPEFRDVDVLTQLVWSAMHGTISLHLSIGHVKWLNWRPLPEISKLMTLALAEGLADPSNRPVAGTPRAADSH